MNSKNCDGPRNDELRTFWSGGRPVWSGSEDLAGRLIFLFAPQDPLARRAVQSIFTLATLTGSVSWSALRTESAKNQFAFANHTFTDGTRGGPGNVVPIDVLNIPAAVADEVVMPRAFRIEAGGSAFDGHFTHQACLNQVAQIVVRSGPRGARIHPIHGFENFCGRGMALAIHKECHQGVALRRTP